jgi:hypothetical protein
VLAIGVKARAARLLQFLANLPGNSLAPDVAPGSGAPSCLICFTLQQRETQRHPKSRQNGAGAERADRMAADRRPDRGSLLLFGIGYIVSSARKCGPNTTKKSENGDAPSLLTQLVARQTCIPATILYSLSTIMISSL